MKSGCHHLKLFLAFSVLVGISSCVLPAGYLMVISYISRFFSVQLPILAFAALLKYLFCCNK